MRAETFLLFVCLVLMASYGEGVELSAKTRADQEAYLRRFAYIGSSSPDTRLSSIVNSDDLFRMAVRKFQRMAGLNETGLVDGNTKKMMEMPRCGVPDEVGMGMVTKRRKRYAAQGSRWPKTSLTYRINNYTPDLPQQTTAQEIRTAFEMWSDISPLTFTEITSKGQAVDIDIGFYRSAHGDNDPFDGPGNTLAHAYFPAYGGDAHFDEDELWTSKQYSGTNLLQVAIHEFGHSLGLSHSNEQDSIMAPFYRQYKPGVKLHSDDIAGIRYIYGRGTYPKTSYATMKPTTSKFQWPLPSQKSTYRPSVRSTTQIPDSSIDICKDSSMDAIFSDAENIYVFKGSSYYVLNEEGILSGYPKPIKGNWQGLPDNIDAAFYWPDLSSSSGSDATIFFFKDDQYWRYSPSRRPKDAGPQKISSKFRGLPTNIDAAFIWSGNGLLYFIKDGWYYRYSGGSSIDYGYPRSLATWKGLPAKIDAAFQYTNSRTYFFSDSNFYRFNDVHFKVDYGYPRTTAIWWFRCTYKAGVGLVPSKPHSDMMEAERKEGTDQFMVSGSRLPTAGVDLMIFAILTSILCYVKEFLIQLPSHS